MAGKPSQALRASELGMSRRASECSPRGGAKKEITVVCYVLMPDGRTVPVEDLTEEELAAWHERQLQRLSEDMSDYYTQHPENYAKLTCGRVAER